MEVDRVAIGIVELDLLAAGADLDLVSELRVATPERPDRGIEVVDVEDDPIPSARLLLAPVRWAVKPRWSV